MKSKNFTNQASIAFTMASYTDGADESPMSEIPGIEEIQESYLAFETLLDSPENTSPTGNQRVVKGTVLAANHSDYTVAINGHKVDALLPRREAGNLSAGDEAEFIVIEDGGEEAAVLSYTRQLAWTQLTELAASGNTCKVRIDSVSKRRGSGRPGGLNVSFGTLKGFIPYSFVADSSLLSYSGPDDRGWGEPSYIDVTVLKAEHDALVFSQKGAIKKVAAAFIEGLTAGDIIPGVVTSIYRGVQRDAYAGQDFVIGAFVEIAPGVSGLVHYSDLNGYRRSVSEILTVGSQVMVQVIASDPSNNRVSLSYTQVESNRQALDAEVVASKQGKITELIIGQTLLGRVKVMLHKQSLENPQEKRCNAAIVTLPNGVDALLHYSDCSDGQMDDIRSLVKTGDYISVTVKGTDLEKGTVKLGYN